MQMAAGCFFFVVDPCKCSDLFHGVDFSFDRARKGERDGGSCGEGSS